MYLAPGGRETINRMKSIDLTPPEQEALTALQRERRSHPEGDYFEHDGGSVRMPGAAKDVNLAIKRETLRSLGHRKLVTFEPGRERGAWIFDLTARAADY